MLYKLHGDVLACCDKELVGKKIIHNGNEVEAKKSFYAGAPISRGELLNLMDGAASINLLGSKAVGAAVEKGIISEESIIMLGGVPHAIIIRI